MIYVYMGGGRDGNQMFHYAVARYVQLKNGDKDLVLDYSVIYNKHREDEGFVRLLRIIKLFRTGIILSRDMQLKTMGIRFNRLSATLNANTWINTEIRTCRCLWIKGV